jgi:Tfp pilus assembly protein PilP
MSTHPHLIACMLIGVSGSAAGQSPSSTSAAPPAAAPRATLAPTPPQDYGYSTDGRRDPFISLVDSGNSDLAKTAAANTKRPPGVAGLMVEEIVVRGIVQSQEQWVAMVGSPDGKTHLVRPGDGLMDGMVSAITPQAVILMQDVNDPMSLEKRREVRKYLRGGEVK